MSKKRKSALTIDEMWLSYRVALPPTLDEREVRKARLAFYAGFAHAIEVLMDLGEDDVPEDVGVIALDRLNQELRQWALTQMPTSGGAA